MNKHTNKLAYESSPYLLQHAHNPVNWYPWGKEAFQKALEENKLIIISIGYSACHWCHVMERESFENEGIAFIMNQNYVCIKVDREERPDVDQIYMEAVQLITGHGGWPLNCFALPDGRPVYGGTYFRPKQWQQVLEGLATSYKSDKSRFLEFASDLVRGIDEAAKMAPHIITTEFKMNDLTFSLDAFEYYFDHENGGTKGAPKFPMPNSILFLLRFIEYKKNQKLLDYVVLTLNKMAFGGIYDQAGGGFCRYSVDELWHVPHFEKMLYDNAQMVELYAFAYKLTGNRHYKSLVYQSVEFITRELTSPEGGCYSALDADSEGVEGKYYVWEFSEIEQLLDRDSMLFSDYYQLTKNGNWEHGKNILHRNENVDLLCERYQISENDLQNKIDKLNKIILHEREKRIKPGLDNKILTSWNALMIKALAKAYRIFNETLFLQKAVQNAEFLLKYMINKDFSLKRNYTNGKSVINGFLDDYAFTIDSFIGLYQATFDEKWLLTAKGICDYVILHFFDNETGLFYYTSNLDEKLISRKKEIHDNVIPSSNSAMANNLFHLGHYFRIDDFVDKARKMLNQMLEATKQSPIYHSNWANLLIKFIYEPVEIKIIGPKALDFRIELDNYILSDAILAGGNQKSEIPFLNEHEISLQTSIYICRNRVCQMPVYNVEDAVKQLNSD